MIRYTKHRKYLDICIARTVRGTIGRGDLQHAINVLVGLTPDSWREEEYQAIMQAAFELKHENDEKIFCPVCKEWVEGMHYTNGQGVHNRCDICGEDLEEV
jgi:hypothetical protein